MDMPIVDEYDVPEMTELRQAALIDGILRVAAYASALSVIVVAPNILRAIDKPLARLDKTLDERGRKRRIMKTVYYMKSRGYLAGDYEHGLRLTAKARRRLRKMDVDNLVIIPLPVWDGLWRVIIYDIPETHRTARIMLGAALRRAGCFQLQKSTWITPFDCRDIVGSISSYHDVERYVTYFEATHLDNARPLVRRFAKKYPATVFDAVI